jgi:hypothetical protein
MKGSWITGKRIKAVKQQRVTLENGRKIMAVQWIELESGARLYTVGYHTRTGGIAGHLNYHRK